MFGRLDTIKTISSGLSILWFHKVIVNDIVKKDICCIYCDVNKKKYDLTKSTK